MKNCISVILFIISLFIEKSAFCGIFHFDLPKLNASIGTKNFTRIDSTRKDHHSKDLLMRELSYRVWYPAMDDDLTPISQWGYENRKLIVEREAKDSGLPKFIIDAAHLDRT